MESSCTLEPPSALFPNATEPPLHGKAFAQGENAVMSLFSLHCGAFFCHTLLPCAEHGPLSAKHFDLGSD